MKSLNFKRKDDSYLRYLEENKRRKAETPFNWDRFIYLSILLVFLLFLMKYAYKTMFYIEGNGQVLFEKIDIRHTNDIRILEFYHKEGEDVKIGDTLFTYFLDDDLFGGIGSGGGSNAVSISTAGKSNSWIDKEIYVMKKNISLNNLKISDYQKILNSYKSDLTRVQNEVILDAVSHTNLENLEYRIERTENDINLFRSQNSIYRKQLSYLNKLKEEEKAKKQNIEIKQNSEGNFAGVGNVNEKDLLAGINDKQGFNYFTCPIQGNITRIMKQPFEVALKTENIMALHQPKNVHIRGYFNQEDLSDIHEGDIVDIEFPDGTKSKGRVERFEFSTRILPQEFQKKFEPTTRTLAVDILPLDNKDLDLWKKYFKLSVKISKRTF
ncbi:MAG TPA: hypothetical protein EYG85_05815 [Crocinitomix sp.]|nr:hypothetical protein [Crocinitomix sp.]